jgi:hypothetical protein
MRSTAVLTQNLHGWARYPRAVCYLFRPERVREVAEALQYGGMSSYLPRGLGTSIRRRRAEQRAGRAAHGTP